MEPHNPEKAHIHWMNLIALRGAMKTYNTESRARWNNKRDNVGTNKRG